MKTPEEDKADRMPTLSGPGEEQPDPPTPPELQGYEILTVLNEGGMGVVYLARQTHPIQRQVALKVIKPGMDSKQVLTRFDMERRALAVLDHPHIAQVYDAGATRDGRPYFAMEYVKGMPITEYCDREKLRIEERLGLFKHVCEAVQHAHQKGIIHRDIKPSNILVYTEGDEAIVKIIDFGVAKAVGQPLTDRMFHTEAGQFVGTPEYMSPEQAEMAGRDIDTRSDIYSLGVVLYELLTGVLPFESKALRAAGMEGVRRVITEQEPKTPSTRLTGLGERATRIARDRRTEVGTLARCLHRELEWIPLKAMRKERARRYRSAAELADDIQHYLEGAPLLAGPESLVYRIRKFAGRNRAFVAGVAAVLTVLVAGIMVSTYFAVSAEFARAEAQAVSDFLRNDLFASVDQLTPEEPNVTVRSLLDAASAKLEEKPPAQPLVEAYLRQTLGETYRRLGSYGDAEAQLRRALDIFRTQRGASNRATLAYMMDLGWLYFLQGRGDQAREQLTKVLEVQQRELGPEHPDVLLCTILLGRVCLAQGLSDQAEERLEGALELARRVLPVGHADTLLCMNNLAELYKNQKRYDEAEPLFVEVLEIRRRTLGPEHRDTLDAVNYLALLYSAKGCYEEAEALLRETLEVSRRQLGEEDELTLVLLNNLGAVYKKQCFYSDAEELLIKAAEGSRRVLGNEHPGTQRSIKHLVDIYEASCKPEEAERWRTLLFDGEGSDE